MQVQAAKQQQYQQCPLSRVTDSSEGRCMHGSSRQHLVNSFHVTAGNIRIVRCIMHFSRQCLWSSAVVRTHALMMQHSQNTVQSAQHSAQKLCTNAKLRRLRLLGRLYMQCLQGSKISTAKKNAVSARRAFTSIDGDAGLHKGRGLSSLDGQP